MQSPFHANASREVPALEKARAYRGRGGEVVRQAGRGSPLVPRSGLPLCGYESQAGGRLSIAAEDRGNTLAFQRCHSGRAPSDLVCQLQTHDEPA